MQPSRPQAAQASRRARTTLREEFEPNTIVAPLDVAARLVSEPRLSFLFYYMQRSPKPGTPHLWG
jgi:hypothetical protein